MEYSYNSSSGSVLVMKEWNRVLVGIKGKSYNGLFVN
jgi:hypothetical protein